MARRPAGGVLLGRTPIKRLAFLGLGALALFTALEHEPPLLNPANPEWAHIAPFRGWLAAHIVVAAIALITGPFQFSSTLRRRSMGLHRWLGRVYVCSTLIASALAFYIGVAFELPANRWLMGSMAGLWFLATAWAWIAIRRRAVDQHRLWITRSYFLTYTFVTTRFIPDLMLPHMGYAGVTALYWVLIVFSLIAPDFLVSRLPNRPRKAAAQPADRLHGSPPARG